MALAKYSMGTGDRFGHQGKAQLQAILKAKNEHDILVTPVWNKSHREHTIIGTDPRQVRNEADQTVKTLGWKQAYYVDADHITRDIVDNYIDNSNFFTIDVAEFIGQTPQKRNKEAFIRRNKDLVGKMEIPGIPGKFMVTEDFLSDWADQYLLAIKKASDLYRYIAQQGDSDERVYEISMDEVLIPQTPIELFFILKTVADYEIPINTLAPKFTGDFYKGIDYVGDISQFVKEFEQDILVLTHGITSFGLPSNLKLSIHSGSDKFSLYPRIHQLIKKYDTGVHLKTSGTTWLEEMIGLASAGGEGLEFAKRVSKEALSRLPELTEPYATVVSIDEDELPGPRGVEAWESAHFTAALTHDENNTEYNPSLRQLLHCAYKIAAERTQKFTELLQKYEKNIAPRVTQNLYERHLKPLFIGT